MNTITVDYSDPAFRKLITAKDVRLFVNKVLSELETDNVELSVSFIDVDEMRDLNFQYREIDGPTDILSFAAEEDVDGFGFITAGRKKRNIGDMLICPSVMSDNAITFGVSDQEELHRLLIHGVLHLTGDNHLTNDMSEPMLIKQEAILNKIWK